MSPPAARGARPAPVQLRRRRAHHPVHVRLHHLVARPLGRARPPAQPVLVEQNAVRPRDARPRQGRVQIHRLEQCLLVAAAGGAVITCP
jgi:hypothetical protein